MSVRGTRVNLNKEDARQAVLLAAALFFINNSNLRAIGAGDTLYTQYAALSIAAHGDTDLNEYLPVGVAPAAIAARQELYQEPCDTPYFVARGLANRSLQERGGRVFSCDLRREGTLA